MTGSVLDDFAAEVGPSGPVVPVGGKTAWTLGGAPSAEAREVRAPTGIVTYDPAEMVVRVRAGTPIAQLDAALAEHGQMVWLDPADPGQATVGGVLAAGQSGLRRLRLGPVRDTVLEAIYVNADGDLTKTGAPVVKSVTGFDLCRLLVGSLGTLGIIAEVVLRCLPIPKTSRWVAATADPFAAIAALYRPSAVLWDGATTWVLLEGDPDDVAGQSRLLGAGWSDVDGPPNLPAYRHSNEPAALGSLTGSFLAEVGVGTVHRPEPPEPHRVSATVSALHTKIKAAFDPTGRLNPGRSVL